MGKLLLPYHDPILGRMWVPSRTNAFWDFARNHGTNVPDDAQCRKTRTFTNLVTNGDFSGGATGWTKIGLPLKLTITDKLVFNGAETATGGYIQDIAANTTDKIYVRFLCNLISDTEPNVTARNYGTFDNSTTITVINGIVGAIVQNKVNGVRIYFRSLEAVTYNSTIDDIQVINLTTLFGAGNEPTAAEMTALFADNGVTYHDGAYALQYQNQLQVVGPTDTGLNRYFDGTDDYGSAANSPALDITAAPLAVFATIKHNLAVGSFGYIVCKNLNSATNNQYGLAVYETTKNIAVWLEGVENTVSVSGLFLQGIRYNVGFIWDGTNIKIYKNGAVVTLAAGGTYSSLLTSRPHFNVGRRETAAAYFKGNIYDLSVYASADTQAIMRHQGYFARRLGIPMGGG